MGARCRFEIGEGVPPQRAALDGVSGLLGLVLGLEELPDESRDDGTDDGGYDEHPDLLDGQGRA